MFCSSISKELQVWMELQRSVKTFPWRELRCHKFPTHGNSLDKNQTVNSIYKDLFHADQRHSLGIRLCPCIQRPDELQELTEFKQSHMWSKVHILGEQVKGILDKGPWRSGLRFIAWRTIYKWIGSSQRYFSQAQTNNPKVRKIPETSPVASVRSRRWKEGVS